MEESFSPATVMLRAHYLFSLHPPSAFYLPYTPIMLRLKTVIRIE